MGIGLNNIQPLQVMLIRKSEIKILILNLGILSKECPNCLIVSMLTLKLFDSYHPLNCETFTFKEQENAKIEYLIGNDKKCQIKLSHPSLEGILGKIEWVNNQYAFISLRQPELTQLNDQDTETNFPYSLGQDDLIRIGDYILMVDQVPSNGKRKLSGKSRKQKPTAVNSQPKASETSQGNSRLQTLKSRLQKRRHQPAAKTDNHSSSQTPLNTTQTSLKSDSLLLPPSDFNSSPNPPQTSLNVTKSNSPVLQWWTEKEINVSCIAIFNETHDLKTFRFLADPPILFNYHPGQFVTLHLNIEGKPIKRSYSISSSPSSPYHLDITVKRVPAPDNLPNVPPGLVSNWLHDHLQVGSQLKLAGPFGKFTCMGKNNPKLLFISAGSGITPMMSMSRWILDTGMERDIIFFHSGRQEADLIYPTELKRMNDNFANFKLFFSLTRLNKEDKWSGLTGRLDKEMLSQIAPDFLEREVYVCGPETFMQGVKQLLESLSFPMQNYYMESFGSSKPSKSSKKTNNHPSTSATILFSESQQTVTTDGTTSILDLAEETGVEIDCSCRSGVCGMCKILKTEGKIEYQAEAEALNEEDQEKGYILSCIAHPKGNVTLKV